MLEQQLKRDQHSDFLRQQVLEQHKREIKPVDVDYNDKTCGRVSLQKALLKRDKESSLGLIRN